MSRLKKNVLWFLVVTVVLMASAPVTPAYAFSIQDLLGQVPTSYDSSRQGLPSRGALANILGSLLQGNFFDKLLNIDKSVASQGSPIKPGASHNKDVVGFYAEWWGEDTASFNSMVKNTDTLKTVAPFWATLNEDASLADRGGNDHAAVVKTAHQKNISVLLMVNNAKQNSNTPPISTVLANSTLRTKAIENIEAYIKKYNLDGVNIDFEMVPAADKDNLTAFMRELSLRLKPQGYAVTIDVFPKQDETNDVSIAYDYEQLAKYADKIMIMAYDNHGVWSGAGPIADIKWVENNLRYALKFMPPTKVDIGVAAYGYDWSSKGVEALEYPAIMNLVQKFGVPIEWDESAKSPHFSYTGSDGVEHQVWFENRESLKYKLDLVNKYDIAGIAIWKLGGEDPGNWQIIKDKLSL
jgi:Predicted glycosyl hydrolase